MNSDNLLLSEMIKMSKSLLDSLSSIGYFVEIIDKEGYYVYCSPCTEKDGFLEDGNNVINKKITEVYHLEENDDSNANKSILIKTLLTQKSLQNVFWVYHAANGRTYYWLINATPIFIDGELRGAMGLSMPYRKVKQSLDFCNELPITTSASSVALNGNSYYQFDDIVHCSKVMENTIREAKRIAVTSVPVLIIGDTGSGKELFAQSIHSYNAEKKGRFIAINCGAIPETLLESTLFGTSGSFTGALDRKGLLEEAQDGTLFLDEINSMPMEMQAKLLRVLEEKKVRRVGSGKEIPIRTRIISATNCDPQQCIKEGKMRADLYYRLSVTTLEIPPLRDRPEDIQFLTQYFIEKYNKKYGKNVYNVSRELDAFLRTLPWNGNVRELKNLLEHAVNLVDSHVATLEKQHLPGSFIKKSQDIGMVLPEINTETNFSFSYKEAKAEYLRKCEEKFAKDTLQRVLSHYSGNVAKAASNLGITRQQLYLLIRKYEL